VTVDNKYKVRQGASFIRLYTALYGFIRLYTALLRGPTVVLDNKYLNRCVCTIYEIF